MPAEQERQSLPALAGWKMWHGLAAQQHSLPSFPGAQEATAGAQSTSTIANTPRGQSLLAEWERGLAPAPKAHPKLSTGLCYVPQTLALLHPILSAQTSSGYHLPDPAVAQPQPWKSQPAARKDCKGEGLVEERKDTAQSPISNVAHTHCLELQPRSGQGCDYFPRYEQGKRVKSTLQELGNAQSVIHPSLHD